MKQELYQHVLNKANKSTTHQQLSDNFLKTLYSNPHPARSAMTFDCLLEGLKDAVAKGTVSVKKDYSGKLSIYNYVSNVWGFFECLARGLVLDEPNKQIVATPFPKFFNYGEITKSFPKGLFQASEKMDGSLGIAFCYDKKWQVATRGSFESDQAIWATEWFNENLTSKLDPAHYGSTILFEIIYPENRIVIDYNFSALVLLGAYHENGMEYTRGELGRLSVETGVRLTKLYNFDTVSDALESAGNLPGDQEGWVLRFPSGYRIKIKGDEYCHIHRQIARCTPLQVWEMVRDGDDMAAFARSLPEEFAKDLKSLVIRFLQELEVHISALDTAIDATKQLSSKELGLKIPSGTKRITNTLDISITSPISGQSGVVLPVWTVAYVFVARKSSIVASGGLSALVRNPGNNLIGMKARRDIFKKFRPANNQLAGYLPTGAKTRFEDE